jgi:hypothetical protein
VAMSGREGEPRDVLMLASSNNSMKSTRNGRHWIRGRGRRRRSVGFRFRSVHDADVDIRDVCLHMPQDQIDEMNDYCR